MGIVSMYTFFLSTSIVTICINVITISTSITSWRVWSFSRELRTGELLVASELGPAPP